MKTIRAKFYCHSVTLIPRFFNEKLGESKSDANLVSEQINLGAVYDEEGPNKVWAASTPSGDLKMTIDNPGAQGYFKPGSSYYLDISEVDD